MSGTEFTVTAHDGISRALAALGRDRALTEVALKNVGELVVRQTRERFAGQKAPDGTPWVPLNSLYAAAKHGPGILRESGQLRDSIVWQMEGDATLRVGTNKVYGRIHQLGGTIVPRTARALAFRLGGKLVIARAVTIPARPYLGVSTGNAEAILGVLEDHIEMLAENSGQGAG
jgi:phage virion morphogenesis protein